MNIIDILLILILIAGIWGGWRRGFILGAFDLVRWIGSILAALWLYQYPARAIAAIAGESIWIAPLAFLLTLFTAGALLRSLEGMLLRRVRPEVHRSLFNRVLGILPGGISGAIWGAVVAAILLALPLPEGIAMPARESALAGRLASYPERLEALLAPAFDEAIARTLNRLSVSPESEGTVKLPYTVSNPRPRPDLEAEMLRLVNQERAAEGLRPLLPDTALRAVARRHSTDMFARGYFSHHTPEGRTPFDRIRSARIRFLTAGENLALAPTVEIAHTGLMNSPGHRANILRGGFGRVGIGIMDGGRRGLMVTQNFRN